MGALRDVGGHCPTCLTEYRPGFEACANDGSRLLPGPVPPEPPRKRRKPVGPPLRWVPVAVYSDLEPAQLMAGLLESEGIDARLDPPDVMSYYGRGTARFLGYRIKVLVLEHRQAEAAEIVAEVESEGTS